MLIAGQSRSSSPGIGRALDEPAEAVDRKRGAALLAREFAACDLVTARAVERGAHPLLRYAGKEERARVQRARVREQADHRGVIGDCAGRQSFVEHVQSERQCHVVRTSASPHRICNRRLERIQIFHAIVCERCEHSQIDPIRQQQRRSRSMGALAEQQPDCGITKHLDRREQRRVARDLQFDEGKMPLSPAPDEIDRASPFPACGGQTGSCRNLIRPIPVVPTNRRGGDGAFENDLRAAIVRGNEGLGVPPAPIGARARYLAFSVNGAPVRCQAIEDKVGE